MGFFNNIAVNPILYLTRTIYPVGQGAFYAERFHSAGLTANVVYDCGGNAAAIDGQVKAFCNGIKPTINALIVSHFHSDHINGINKLIENCEVCKLFIPYVSPQVFLLDFLYNILVDRNDQSANRFLLKFALPALTKKESQTVQGLNVFLVDVGDCQLCDTDDAWSYSLYYPSITPDNNGLVDAFLSECNTIHLSDGASRNYLEEGEYETIAGLFKEDDAFDKLATLFKNHFKGNQNVYSLLMLSKPAASTAFLKEEDGHFASCLYTGDCPMSENAVTVIRSMDPGIIQVPHHGSKNNFVADIYKSDQYSFVSAGSDNRYGHPDGFTLGTINNMCKKCFLVTEMNQGLTHTYELASTSKNVLSKINITK